MTDAFWERVEPLHKRFLEWEKAGVHRPLWNAGLAEYDDMEGIAWRWHRIDGVEGG